MLLAVGKSEIVRCDGTLRTYLLKSRGGGSWELSIPREPAANKGAPLNTVRKVPVPYRTILDDICKSALAVSAPIYYYYYYRYTTLRPASPYCPFIPNQHNGWSGDKIPYSNQVIEFFSSLLFNTFPIPADNNCSPFHDHGCFNRIS